MTSADKEYIQCQGGWSNTEGILKNRCSQHEPLCHISTSHNSPQRLGGIAHRDCHLFRPTTLSEEVVPGSGGIFVEIIFDLKVRARISKWTKNSLSHQLTSCANIVPNMEPTLGSTFKEVVGKSMDGWGFRLWWVELVWLWLELVWLDLESNTGVEVSSVLRTMLGSRISGLHCWICKSTLCPPWNKKKSHSRKRVIDNEPDLDVLQGSLLTFTLYHLILIPSFSSFLPMLQDMSRSAFLGGPQMCSGNGDVVLAYGAPQFVGLGFSVLIALIIIQAVTRHSTIFWRYFQVMTHVCYIYIIIYIRDSFTVPFCCLFIHLLIYSHKHYWIISDNHYTYIH